MSAPHVRGPGDRSIDQLSIFELAKTRIVRIVVFWTVSYVHRKSQIRQSSVCSAIPRVAGLAVRGGQRALSRARPIPDSSVDRCSSEVERSTAIAISPGQ